MEKNYADANLSGENLLPGLTELSKYGLSFDDFYQLQHQDYTLAGMIASYCAVPYKSIKNTNSLFLKRDYKKYLNKLYKEKMYYECQNLR